VSQVKELSAGQLRWQVDEDQLNFESTREVQPVVGIVGQPIAMEALRFGLECQAPGQNVYVRGVTGSGRMSMIRSLLNELNPQARRKLDRCYVHNFTAPDQPRLITLPAGRAKILRSRTKDLADFIEQRLSEALNSPPIKAQREAISNATQRDINQITQPLENDLGGADMTLVKLQTGPVTQTAIFPVVDGEPMPPDQLRQQVQSGKAEEQVFKDFEKNYKRFSKTLQEVSEQANQVYQKGMQRLQDYVHDQARRILNNVCLDLRQVLNNEAVNTFLDEVINDAIEYRLRGDGSELPDANLIYGVNVVSCYEDNDGCPVIEENMPTVGNLLGGIEPEWINGAAVSNYRSIRAGSLLHADGGYLVLDAHDVLTEPGAWRLLMRSLRTGRLEIVPQEMGWPYSSQSLKPEPIDISVRVILIGSSSLYYQLDQLDQDFSDLFKVLADFNSEIDRDEKGVNQYAGVLAKMCADEELLHFDKSGVAAMAEHGARIAARKGKISARFGRIADIVREAHYLAKKAAAELISREHVEDTVRRTKYRASLPSKRFQNFIQDGTIYVATQGEIIGQINGLAVIAAGPLSYGFPARITATVGAGRSGIIDIEGAAAMSGAIHTKGFHILGGLLRYLLQTDHPLAFSASVAFEQSYGGIDGDSASGAEICCLLSALTDTPIKQSFAMTGAIDQHGHIQAIGGVNEKIEGFYDTCQAMGLTGDQGVIIPYSNAADLMLRDDVVEACDNGQFHIYPVKQVHDALTILTGVNAGEIQEDGQYPDASLLRTAQVKALEFWQKSVASPAAHAANNNGQDSQE